MEYKLPNPYLSSSSSSNPSFLLNNKDFLLNSLIHNSVFSLVVSPLVVLESYYQVQDLNTAANEVDEDRDNKVELLEDDLFLDLRSLHNANKINLTALFSAHIPTTIQYTLNSTFQPIIQELFSDDNELSHIASSIIINTLTSPLDYMRTSLLVHKSPSLKLDLKYMIPTFVSTIISRCFRTGTVYFLIEEYDLIGLPLSLGCISGLFLEMVVRYPIEMGRRRLGVQSSLEERKFTSIFQVWSVLFNDPSSSSKKKRKHKRSTTQQDRYKQWESMHFSVNEWSDRPVIGSESSHSSTTEFEITEITKPKQRNWIIAGLANVYRGFWCRFLIELVGFVFDEIGREDDDMGVW